MLPSFCVVFLLSDLVQLGEGRITLWRGRPSVSIDFNFKVRSKQKQVFQGSFSPNVNTSWDFKVDRRANETFKRRIFFLTLLYFLTFVGEFIPFQLVFVTKITQQIFSIISNKTAKTAKKSVEKFFSHFFFSSCDNFPGQHLAGPGNNIIGTFLLSILWTLSLSATICQSVFFLEIFKQLLCSVIKSVVGVDHDYSDYD